MTNINNNKPTNGAAVLLLFMLIVFSLCGAIGGLVYHVYTKDSKDNKDSKDTIPSGTPADLTPSDENDTPSPSGPVLQDSPDCKLVLYNRKGFESEVGVLTNKSSGGVYKNVTWKDLSSVRLEGDVRCRAKLYNDPNMNETMNTYILKRSDALPFVSDLSRTGMDQDTTRYMDLEDSNLGAIKVYVDSLNLTPAEESKKAGEESGCVVRLFDNNFNGSSLDKSVYRTLHRNPFPLEVRNLNEETPQFDDKTSAVYIRGKNCRMQLWARTGFDDTGDTALITTGTDNEAYARLDGNMVYKGSTYAGDVRNNQLGSFKVFKEDI